MASNQTEDLQNTLTKASWGNIQKQSSASLIHAIHEEQSSELVNKIIDQDFVEELELAIKYSLEEQNSKQQENGDEIDPVIDSDLAFAMKLQELENEEYSEEIDQTYSDDESIGNIEPKNSKSQPPVDNSLNSEHLGESETTRNKYDPAMSDELDKYEDVEDLAYDRFILPNKVFNGLRTAINKKDSPKGAPNNGRKDQMVETENGALDPVSRQMLQKMISNQVIQQIYGIVKTGKKAHIFHVTKPSDSQFEESIILKIFKINLNEFSLHQNRSQDNFVQQNIHAAHSKEKYCKILATREFRNLSRAHRAGINCPKPILQKQHMILMSFIGKNDTIAPQLNETDVSKTVWTKLYFEILKTMKELFQKAKIIHGNLSENNILYFNKKCYFIDFAESVEVVHPKADEILIRDIDSINGYFQTKNVPIIQAEEVYNYIVEQNINKEENHIHQTLVALNLS
jgi:RIO kinase 1